MHLPLLLRVLHPFPCPFLLITIRVAIRACNRLATSVSAIPMLLYCRILTRTSAILMFTLTLVLMLMLMPMHPLTLIPTPTPTVMLMLIPTPMCNRRPPA